MLVRCNSDTLDYETISHSVTLVPRLDYSVNLLDEIIDVIEEKRFVTAIIPLELLWEPYSIFLNDEKIFFREINNNGTHVWLNMKPETSGEIIIVGTTVIPEFPIIAPLAIGFLMILTVPLMRKFSLH